MGPAVLAVALAVAMLGGCGGGGAIDEAATMDTAQTTSPYAGNYVLFGRGEQDVVAITRIRPNGTLVSVVGGTSIWGNFIARGQVATDGTTTFLANNVEMRDGSKVNITFQGQFGLSMAGGWKCAGTFLFSNSTQPGNWVGRRWGDASNSGRWTFDIPAATGASAQAAFNYDYTQCFAMFGRYENQTWLVLVVEGKSTVYPCEGVFLIPGIDLRPFNIPVEIYGAGFSIHEPRADWYLDNNLHRPKLTLTALDLRLGGSVSGLFTGSLMCYEDAKPEITMTSAAFNNVKILYRVPLTIPKPPS